MPMRRASYRLLVSIAICALAISSATASLGVKGAIFNAEAAPGEHVVHELNVSLSSDETSPVNMSADLMDWHQNPSGLSIGVKDNPDIAPYSARKFLSVSPSNFTLAPGSYQKVKIEGDMPAGDGCRYAVVFVHIIPSAEKENTGIAISFGMNTLVLLTIKDSKLVKTGEIDDMSLEEPVSSRQQNFTMAFENTGNYHYRINASALLKDEKGDILATALPASRDIKEPVVPTARRKISLSFVPSSELKPGNYVASAEVALVDGTVLATKETSFQIGP